MTGGTSVRAFPVPPLPSLSEMAEGTLVKLNESGAPVEFYVAKHDYESGLNGAGRTLVVRKDCSQNYVWDYGTSHIYAGSYIDLWFNNNYKVKLDDEIISLITTTKIQYTPEERGTTVSVLERAIFALSLTELGETHTFANIEGTALPIAELLKIAYLDGVANKQWTRSPYTSTSYYAWSLTSSGSPDYRNLNEQKGVRPCFTLPSTVLVDEAMNIVA